MLTETAVTKDAEYWSVHDVAPAVASSAEPHAPMPATTAPSAASAASTESINPFDEIAPEQLKDNETYDV